MYSTKVRTTDEAINAATDRLASDITTLAGKRDMALSAFRQAATDLDNINSGLRDKINKFNDLAAFIGSQIIEDNTKVRQRILDIIGE